MSSSSTPSSQRELATQLSLRNSEAEAGLNSMIARPFANLRKEESRFHFSIRDWNPDTTCTIRHFASVVRKSNATVTAKLHAQLNDPQVLATADLPTLITTATSVIDKLTRESQAWGDCKAALDLSQTETDFLPEVRYAQSLDGTLNGIVDSYRHSLRVSKIRYKPATETQMETLEPLYDNLIRWKNLGVSKILLDRTYIDPSKYSFSSSATATAGDSNGDGDSDGEESEDVIDELDNDNKEVQMRSLVEEVQTLSMETILNGLKTAISEAVVALGDVEQYDIPIRYE